VRLFGHIAHADPSQDHSCALWAAINHPPVKWRHRTGWPRRLGFAQSNWMSASATPASFLRGNVCKTNIMAESCGESYALDAIWWRWWSWWWI